MGALAGSWVVGLVASTQSSGEPKQGAHPVLQAFALECMTHWDSVVVARAQRKWFGVRLHGAATGIAGDHGNTAKALQNFVVLDNASNLFSRVPLAIHAVPSSLWHSFPKLVHDTIHHHAHPHPKRHNVEALAVVLRLVPHAAVAQPSIACELSPRAIAELLDLRHNRGNTMMVWYSNGCRALEIACTDAPRALEAVRAGIVPSLVHMAENSPRSAEAAKSLLSHLQRTLPRPSLADLQHASQLSEEEATAVLRDIAVVEGLECRPKRASGLVPCLAAGGTGVLWGALRGHVHARWTNVPRELLWQTTLRASTRAGLGSFLVGSTVTAFHHLHSRLAAGPLRSSSRARLMLSASALDAVKLVTLLTCVGSLPYSLVGAVVGPWLLGASYYARE